MTSTYIECVMNASFYTDPSRSESALELDRLILLLHPFSLSARRTGLTQLQNKTFKLTKTPGCLLKLGIQRDAEDCVGLKPAPDDAAGIFQTSAQQDLDVCRFVNGSEDKRRACLSSRGPGVLVCRMNGLPGPRCRLLPQPPKNLCHRGKENNFGHPSRTGPHPLIGNWRP